jgi:hypothetical protein
VDAGHGGDLLLVPAIHHEERVDEVIDGDAGLPHQPPQVAEASKAAGAREETGAAFS